MMKGLVFQQQQVDQENMSNLTSASNEAANSFSEIGTTNNNSYYSQQQQQQYLQPPTTTTTSHPHPQKRKRNLPGNPDPEADVIAMSPKSLMATNRFVCEICNKGFQRDQNLQLHRRGHNLPWKLKTRTGKEVIRKKVYVCPEPTCVHHHASRALGDLTGIKKHFSRKHGEKKWKCDKCSKRYAVQSDWKAHSKTCGTREYRCDCGTLFSRRDSFITHRAFCDALAEETARSNNNTLFLHSQINQFSNNPQIHKNPNSQLKREQQEQQQHQISFNQLPSWLAPPPTLDHLYSSRLDQFQEGIVEKNPQIQNPNPSTLLQQPPPPPPPHMSATGLLQKAAQMGAVSSSSASSMMSGPHSHHQVQQGHVTPDDPLAAAAANDNDFGLNLLSRDHQEEHVTPTTIATTTTGSTAGLFGQGYFGNNKVANAAAPNSSFLHDVMMMNSSGFELGTTSFEDAFGGILVNNHGSKKLDDENPRFLFDHDTTLSKGGGGGGNEGLTRDFLGLRPLSHSDILSIAAGIGNGNSINSDQNSWRG